MNSCVDNLCCEGDVCSNIPRACYYTVSIEESYVYCVWVWSRKVVLPAEYYTCICGVLDTRVAALLHSSNLTHLTKSSRLV